MREILFIDVSPVALSVIAALGATATLAIFVWHPPWRQKRPRHLSVSDRGCRE
jgi:amino acid permease